MANSLDDIDGLDILFVEPDWIKAPTTTPTIRRRLLQFNGTVQQLEAMTDYAPFLVRLGYTLLDRDSLYSLVDFFHSKQGRLKRFWLQAPKGEFKLIQTAASGSNILVCEPNFAHQFYTGTERIYILMSDGDVVVRKVINAVWNDTLDILTLTLNSNLDREVSTTNQFKIGKLLLVRFDSDTFSLSVKADAATQVDLAFRELPVEYT